jgi:hypothetical protein
VATEPWVKAGIGEGLAWLWRRPLAAVLLVSTIVLALAIKPELTALALVAFVCLGIASLDVLRRRRG